MGRKPNQLILEFFDRGQKLEDASNRYQHTCKACGEKFPKGRIDSLTTHLVKKCPAISLRDRQKALLQLNDLPDLADGTRSKNGEVQLNGPTVELPVGNRNWTALETLAEVSRQIDLSEKHDDRTPNSKGPESQRKSDEAQRADKFELQEQWTPDNPPLSYEARVQRDKKLLNQKLAARRGSESASESPNIQPDSAPSTSSSPKISMATAASMAAAASARFIPSMVDPQLLEEGLPQASNEVPAEAESTFATAPPQQEMAWPMLDGSGGNMYPDPENPDSKEDTAVDQASFARLELPRLAPNPVLTTEFAAEYGNGSKMNGKQKVRGRFTASRRKEVQEVRKRGACMRCRMLKKPCSGDSPCNTCRNVESARLWKQPCIRTRIADELDMYSAGLHAVLAYHEVNKVKSRISFQRSKSLIEASHYPETTIYATFEALEGRDLLQMESSSSSSNNIDPSLGMEGGFEPASSSSVRLRILDNDNDNLPEKLLTYMKRMSSYFFEKEPSPFMHTTLSTAHVLSIEKHDSLLERVLELWSTVHILVDHELRWSIFEKQTVDSGNSDNNNNKLNTNTTFSSESDINDNNNSGGEHAVAPSSEPLPLPLPLPMPTAGAATSSSPPPPSVLIDHHTSESTYTLLSLQLNAAAEKKAAEIGRQVLGELERRLLQRASSSSANFETFLVALILLNCVEKSTWLFKYWEQDSFKARWPLDKTPVWYGAQGDRITDMLQMLLRMRGVPPKTYQRAGDGVLATDGDPVAREYFEKLQLRYVDVLAKPTSPTFDPTDSRCYEMRFCAKLLLPTN